MSGYATRDGDVACFQITLDSLVSVIAGRKSIVGNCGALVYK